MLGALVTCTRGTGIAENTEQRQLRLQVKQVPRSSKVTQDITV